MDAVISAARPTRQAQRLPIIHGIHLCSQIPTGSFWRVKARVGSLGQAGGHLRPVWEARRAPVRPVLDVSTAVMILIATSSKQIAAMPSVLVPRTSAPTSVMWCPRAAAADVHQRNRSSVTITMQWCGMAASLTSTGAEIIQSHRPRGSTLVNARREDPGDRAQPRGEPAKPG